MHVDITAIMDAYEKEIQALTRRAILAEIQVKMLTQQRVVEQSVKEESHGDSPS